MAKSSKPAPKPKAQKAAKPVKSTEEVTLEQKKQQLVDRAKKEGRIDQHDITKLIPETPDHAEVLDALYTELADLNIDITAAEPAGTTAFSGGVWESEEDDEEEA